MGLGPGHWSTYLVVEGHGLATSVQRTASSTRRPNAMPVGPPSIRIRTGPVVQHNIPRWVTIGCYALHTTSVRRPPLTQGVSPTTHVSSQLPCLLGLGIFTHGFAQCLSSHAISLSCFMMLIIVSYIRV